MSHFADIDHFSEHPDSADDNSSCLSGADYSHPDPTYYHPKVDTAPPRYSIDSGARHSYPIKAHRSITGLSSHRADYVP